LYKPAWNFAVRKFADVYGIHGFMLGAKPYKNPHDKEIRLRPK
jgi:hypothetical protein